MIYLSEKNTLPMVFCFENYSDLLWEENVLVIKKTLENEGEKLQKNFLQLR